MKTLEELKQEGSAPLWMEGSGYKTLSAGYLLPGETPKDMWRRVSDGSATRLNKPELADKFFDLFWKGWLCGATPVLSNMNTSRGLPISCFSLQVGDNTDNILMKAHELAMLSKYGGGVGIYMGDVRPAGSTISTGGTTDGVVPFIKIYDSVVTGISQGNVRRGAAAVYLPIEHGDAEAFLRIRRPEGDPNRQCLNMHHGVTIKDDFMKAALSGDAKAVKMLSELYKSRIETGEPYVFFHDNVQKNIPQLYRDRQLPVLTSNICSEILLPTDPEHTFVCCLSSMNLAKWEEWKDTDAVYLATWFLEGVLTEFIDKAKNINGFGSAVRFAQKSRAIGLGVLGFHTLLQSEMTALHSFRAKILNKAIFKHINTATHKASQDMAKEYGEPEWCVGYGVRHSSRIALAPTASNSIISGNVSAGIEPINSNAFTKGSAKGIFLEFNPLLKKLLIDKEQDTEQVWKTVVANNGSVSHLDFLSKEEKEVFRTAFEIDQRVLIDLAADRQPFICQGQSLNLFFSADVDPQYFHEVHVQAWEKGLNTLYYVRSNSVLKADLSSRGECTACEA
jgi:ribonucleoside-diphosphate reductase alpha chain